MVEAATPTKTVTKKIKPPQNGWFPKLNLGLNTSLVSTSNVPGVEDGLTMSFGLVIGGELLMRRDKHEWKSTLKLVHTQTKTPSLEQFVKTADDLAITSYYVYRIGGEYAWGFHAGLQFNTALFPGEMSVGKDTKVKLIKLDGSSETQLVQKSQPLPLTPPFSPFILKQKLGFELTPHKSNFVKLELKFDGVAQEIWASGYVVADDVTTPEVDLKQLQDYVQAGIEMRIALTGNVSKQISYAFLAELMYPLITNVQTSLKGFDLFNADLGLKVSFKLAKWAAFDYIFQAKMIPLLTEKWQVTNNLVLSLKADIL